MTCSGCGTMITSGGAARIDEERRALHSFIRWFLLERLFCAHVLVHACGIVP
jgi:hypothetical protein